MFIALFELLFYIVHCCIDIEDRSLSGLYFNKIILSYLILRVYASVPKSKTNIYRDGNTVVISRMDSNLYPVKKIRKVFIVVE
jgi:hypothetical protein